SDGNDEVFLLSTYFLIVFFLSKILKDVEKKYKLFLLCVFFHMSAVVNVFIYAVYMIFGSKKYSYAKIVFSILI
ncbi:hypothetical protein UY868_25335, partial [Escherichia coli]|nr:hypothetical protein [Escherichia coli]